MNLAKNVASRREILSRFPSRSRFYFGRQGSCRDSRKHPGEILAAEKLLPGEDLDEIRGRIPARFWPPRFSLPGENHGEIPGRIAAAGNFASWRESYRDPAGIPAERKKSRRPKSRRDPGGIPVEITAGSRQDPGPYFTRVGLLVVSTVNSEFLSVGSELDTGFALLCVLGDMEETYCLQLLFMMCPGVPDPQRGSCAK